MNRPANARPTDYADMAQAQAQALASAPSAPSALDEVNARLGQLLSHLVLSNSSLTGIASRLMGAGSGCCDAERGPAPLPICVLAEMATTLDALDAEASRLNANCTALSRL